MFALTATPFLTIATYAWGWSAMVVWGLYLTTRAMAWRRLSASHRWRRLALEILAVSVIEAAIRGWHPLDVFFGAARWPLVACAILPAFFVFHTLSARDEGPLPSTLADRWQRASMGPLVLGAAACVVADEPILPIMVAVAALGLALLVAAVLWERRALRWLAAVARGRDPRWTLSADGDPTKPRARLTERPRDDAPYRSSEGAHLAAIPVDLARDGDAWKVSFEKASKRAWFLLGASLLLLLGAPLAVVSHAGNADASHTRMLIVEGRVPDAVRARVPRKRSFQRVTRPRVPGVTLWRDCKFPTCHGVTVAVDDRTGRALDVPEVMVRVRDRSLLEQLAVREALLAGGGDRGAPDEVRRCGPRVWVQRSGRGILMQVTAHDLQTGERWWADGRPLIDCDARRLRPIPSYD